MASTNILPFDERGQGMMSDAEYAASVQRQQGVSPGVADPALHNKLYRQVSMVAAALAQVAAGRGYDAMDDNFPALVEALDKGLGREGPPGPAGSTVFLTADSILYPGDAHGAVGGQSITLRLLGYVGGAPVLPEVGGISGAPEGMTVEAGEPDGDALPIIVTVEDGATLGGTDSTAGIVDIQVIAPIVATLSIVWAKLNAGKTGGRGAPGEDGHAPYVGANGNWYAWDDAAGGYADTGVHAQGPVGPDGKGLAILGYYDVLADLRAAVPAPDVGDAYGIGLAAPYNIYVATGQPAPDDWRDNGQLQGPPGEGGTDGTGIERIERTGGTGAPGTTDTYTIYLTDGGTATFTVYNGGNGERGETGETGGKGDDGVTPSMRAGTTTTLAPGTPAIVERDPASPDAEPVFNFGIPRGEIGVMILPRFTGTLTAAGWAKVGDRYEQTASFPGIDQADKYKYVPYTDPASALTYGQCMVMPVSYDGPGAVRYVAQDLPDADLVAILEQRQSEVA